MHQGIVKDRQIPLCAHYAKDPSAAWIEDEARTAHRLENDSFHGGVRFAGSDVFRFGIHRALGGDHDLPNPGDLLCGSLAACLDATLRLIADRLDVKLASLDVRVVGEADVRGALRVDTATPVGFQRMTCSVRVVPETNADRTKLDMLLAAAEHSCIVLNTLRNAVQIRTCLAQTADAS